MKKTFTWIGAKGNKFELEAECAMEVRNIVLDADGIEYETKKKEICINAKLIAKVDEKVVETCNNINFWRIIDLENGLKRIWGINSIGFNAEIAAEIEKFLNKVIESAKTEEVKEFEAEKRDKEATNEIRTAQRIIEIAEVSPKHADGKLYTYNELQDYLKSYNNMFNEGQEGYLPRYVCQEEYEKALEILNR
jgi:hypothetical protein